MYWEKKIVLGKINNDARITKNLHECIIERTQKVQINPPPVPYFPRVGEIFADSA